MSSTEKPAFLPFRRPPIAVALAALALASPLARAGGTIEPGSAFPDLTGFALEGSVPAIDSAKVVIVDFWASWCGPCKSSFPVFDELHDEFAPKGLVIVAVSVDQNVRAMKAYLERHKPHFAIVRDAQQKLVQAAAVPTMPTSFVLDAKGVVRFVHVGFHGEQSRREYIEQINAILAEAS